MPNHARLSDRSALPFAGSALGVETTARRDAPALRLGEIELTPVEPTWSIRSLLNPVVVRLLIYGVDPFDLERVLRRVEATPFRNARQLESKWLSEWEALASNWQQRMETALRLGRRTSARAHGQHAASCRLAQFLINPGELSRRRELYVEYAKSYAAAAATFEVPVMPLRLALDRNLGLRAHLHLPNGPGPHPTAAVFAGLGSCKEEMHTLARLLVERGVAALVSDMPGNGESLFLEGVTCGSDNLSAAFRAVADFVEQCPDLDGSRLGAVGLCMGGGYAYRACFEQRRYRWCATLFPLFIDVVADEKTPQWMKSGPWYDLQTGGKEARAFRAEVGWQDRFTIDCPFFMVHSRHDNWMTLDDARILFEHATSTDRELLVVDEEPAYATGETVTHSMPVGEQMAWVGPALADWVAARARPLP